MADADCLTKFVDGLEFWLSWLPDRHRHALAQLVIGALPDPQPEPDAVGNLLGELKTGSSVARTEIRTRFGVLPNDRVTSLVEACESWLARVVKPTESRNIRIALRKRHARDLPAQRDALIEAIGGVFYDGLPVDDRTRDMVSVLVTEHLRTRGSGLTIATALEALPAYAVTRIRYALDRGPHIGRRHQSLSGWAGWLPGRSGDGPSEKLAAKDEAAAIAAAVARLPAAYQTIIRLRLEGLGFEHIAASMGAPQSTVYRWYRNALGRLAERLARPDG